MKCNNIKAPFPYFGGKAIVAKFIWQLLGNDIKKYFEPFAGSLAVLLARERGENKIYNEIVNDLDCLLINTWRALKENPKEVAKLCASPNSQVLYWQRIIYIIKNKENLLKNILKDDCYYNTKLAAYWLYYKACEIGYNKIDKVNIDDIFNNLENGIKKGRTQLTANVGIHSKYISVIGKENINMDKTEKLILWFNEIKHILENTKIMCGDWKRLFTEGSHWQDNGGKQTIGIFFDPPYSDINRKNIYRLDSYSVAKEVNDFCVKNANKKTYRIILAGYEGEHNNLEALGYKKYVWKPQGGYGNLTKGKEYTNKNKERLWASSSCNNIEIKGTINEYLKGV